MNGSTSHSNSKVIRVGANAQFTGGKPIQDINDTRTISIRCIAGNANAASPNNYAYASNSTTGTTIMTIIECQQVGPAGRGYINFAGSTINLYDGTFGNLIAASNNNSGTVNLLTEADVYEII